ncbi:MAG: ribosome biogenesis GTPase Der [Deltaproteobacteria bacterium]|nr:ribosome biogenesis GTPase Der [Deltaproteobacteria bacterium]
MSLPVVAIVGRPNVGKSTLFNRLVGFRKATVHDRPGVTRDRLYEEAELLKRHVVLIDTGGLEPDGATDMLKAIRRQSQLAIEEADVIVFVVDASSGYTPPDQEVAGILRRSHKPVLLAVNKVDGPKQDQMMGDFWELGLEPLPISAAHGRGVYELLEAIEERLPEASEEELAEADELSDELLPFDDEDGPPDDDAEDDPLPQRDDEEWGNPEDYPDVELPEEEIADDEPEPALDAPIKFAVLGRPNIGKSTLINRLIGEDRHVVLDQPGTTTDPVDSPFESLGRRYIAVDTAGVRRKSQIRDDLERYISFRSIRAIERCHVAVLMIDGTEGITDQDARLAQLCVQRGRAVVLLVNKWDLAKDLQDVDSKKFAEEIERKLPHLSWAKFLFVSAKTGRGCQKILGAVDEAYTAFNKRISTSRLNRFLAAATNYYTPPQRHNHPVRLYYMTQIRVRPPTFALWSNTPEGVVPAYQRYLSNRLRDEYGYWGTPLRIVLRRRRKIGEQADGT